MKILIVEDDKHLNKAICDMLKNIADTTPIYDGESAIYAVEQNIFDLIILDVMLPHVDGFTILQKIREVGKTPVIMLTAKDSVADKVKGLKLGADDYMTKPFYRDELLARVNALLRRYNNNFSGSQLIFKDLKFDLAQKKITINGETLDLTGKSYDILEYLIRNNDIIITKEQLFNRIWGFESETIWSVVEVYVSNIRKTFSNIHSIR
jgi:two-component system response regulator CiaR